MLSQGFRTLVSWFWIDADVSGFVIEIPPFSWEGRSAISMVGKINEGMFNGTLESVKS